MVVLSFPSPPPPLQDSPHFRNERRKEAAADERAAALAARAERLSSREVSAALRRVDAETPPSSPFRDLSRTWLHVDMDAFFASVERREDPSLDGAPFAVGGRDMVSTASYEARTFGVRSAMPGFIAERLCPQLRFVRPRFDAYKTASRRIRAALRRFDPGLEMRSLDEAALDVTDYMASKGIGVREVVDRVRESVRRATGWRVGVRGAGGEVEWIDGQGWAIAEEGEERGAEEEAVGQEGEKKEFGEADGKERDMKGAEKNAGDDSLEKAVGMQHVRDLTRMQGAEEAAGKVVESPADEYVHAGGGAQWVAAGGGAKSEEDAACVAATSLGKPEDSTEPGSQADNAGQFASSASAGSRKGDAASEPHLGAHRGAESSSGAVDAAPPGIAAPPRFVFSPAPEDPSASTHPSTSVARQSSPRSSACASAPSSPISEPLTAARSSARLKASLGVEIRFLTCSVGAAPNRLLAKIASDVNKPDGACIIPPDASAVEAFVAPMGVRKVPGIGKVSERTLAGLGIATCSQLWERRGVLGCLLGIKHAASYARAGKGWGATRRDRSAHPGKSSGDEMTKRAVAAGRSAARDGDESAGDGAGKDDGEDKGEPSSKGRAASKGEALGEPSSEASAAPSGSRSGVAPRSSHLASIPRASDSSSSCSSPSHTDRRGISRERTFRATASHAELSRRLRELSMRLAEDMRDKGGLRGRTVTLKVKLASFELLTRSHTLPGGQTVSMGEEIDAVAQLLLAKEMPLKARLIGVRVGGFPVRERGQLALWELAGLESKTEADEREHGATQGKDGRSALRAALLTESEAPSVKEDSDGAPSDGATEVSRDETLVLHLTAPNGATLRAIDEEDRSASASRDVALSEAVQVHSAPNTCGGEAQRLGADDETGLSSSGAVNSPVAIDAHAEFKPGSSGDLTRPAEVSGDPLALKGLLEGAVAEYALQPSQTRSQPADLSLSLRCWGDASTQETAERRKTGERPKSRSGSDIQEVVNGSVQPDSAGNDAVATKSGGGASEPSPGPLRLEHASLASLRAPLTGSLSGPRSTAGASHTSTPMSDDPALARGGRSSSQPAARVGGSSQRGGSASSDPEPHWACPTCTLHNALWRSVCAVCAAPRPAEALSAATRSRSGHGRSGKRARSLGAQGSQGTGSVTLDVLLMRRANKTARAALGATTSNANDDVVDQERDLVSSSPIAAASGSRTVAREAGKDASTRIQGPLWRAPQRQPPHQPSMPAGEVAPALGNRGAPTCSAADPPLTFSRPGEDSPPSHPTGSSESPVAHHMASETPPGSDDEEFVECAFCGAWMPFCELEAHRLAKHVDERST